MARSLIPKVGIPSIEGFPLLRSGFPEGFPRSKAFFPIFKNSSQGRKLISTYFYFPFGKIKNTRLANWKIKVKSENPSVFLALFLLRNLGFSKVR
jgi:hypothetical protein